MDEKKRAIMYPTLEPESGALSTSQRAAACASIGLPTELPPSYDMALAGMSSRSETNTVFQINDMNRTPMHEMSYPGSITQVTVPAQQNNSSQINHFPEATVQQPGLVRNVRPVTDKLGPFPSAVTCPECGECKTTRMHFTPNTRTHLFALLLCLAGWCCCACCVPYCMSSCKTGTHYCSKCSKFLGSYNPNEK